MAKRRGNNEGTVLKRKKCTKCNKIKSSSNDDMLINCSSCGSILPNEFTWFTQATIGIDTKTGKSKRRSFYGKTRKEAVEKMQKALHEIKTGTYIEPTKYTLGKWIDYWLENYKKGEICESTYDSYESYIRVHIKPDLGGILLSKIQTHMLQEYYNRKEVNGRSDGKGGLSSRTVNYLHTIMRLALDQAVREGLIYKNVALAAKPSKLKSKKGKTLTEEKLIFFIEFIKNDRHSSSYILAITTGLRRGELLGLCWDCVDLKEKTIRIERQLLVLKSGIDLREGTKNDSSRRKIHLTDDAVKALKKEKLDQEKKKRWLLDSYEDLNLVFARDNGSFLDPREFSKRFKRLLEKAGLPEIRLHDLRHTHASLLIARNIHPKVVQERLGHSSISTTLDTYSHLFEGIEA